jgi:hypothetical protein
VRRSCADRHSIARSARLCRIQIMKSLHSPERCLRNPWISIGPRSANELSSGISCQFRELSEE